MSEGYRYQPPINTNVIDKPAGIDTSIHVENGNVIIHRTADAQPVLDEIARIKQITNGKSITGELFHVGRIPSIVVEKYCNERGITFHDFIIDDTHVTALMNDPDYKHLRIWEGRA